MAIYEVQDPETGITLELEGDSPPTEAELEQVFASFGAPEKAAIPTRPNRAEQPTADYSYLTPSLSRRQQEIPATQRSAQMDELVAAADILDLPSRALATVRGMPMNDPDSYLLAPEVQASARRRQEARSRFQERPGETPQQIYERMRREGVPLAPEGLAAPVTEMVGRTLSDPTLGLASLGRNAVRGVVKGAEAIGRGVRAGALPAAGAAAVGIPGGAFFGPAGAVAGGTAGAALAKNIFTLPKREAEALQALLRNPERMKAAAATSPEAVAREAGEQVSTLRERARTQLQEGVEGVPSDLPPAFAQQLPPGSRGEIMEDAFEAAKRQVGYNFGERSKALFGSIPKAGKALPSRMADASEYRLLGREAPANITADKNRMRVNAAQQPILEALLKFDLDAGVGTVGGRRAGEGAIWALRETFEDVKNVKDLETLLTKRVLMDGKIKWWRENAKVPVTPEDEAVLKYVRNQWNDVIENGIKNSFNNPKTGEAAAELWKANLKYYQDIADATEPFGQMIRTKNVEELPNSLQRIGAPAVRTFFSVANKNPELEIFAQQVRASYLDNILARGTKDGVLDPDAFKTAYRRGIQNESKTKEFNDAILSPEQRAQINKAIARYEKTISEIPKAPSASNVLRSALRNEDHVLAELKFLDDVFGKNLAGRSKEISQAQKLLGMSEEGTLPLTPPVEGVGKISFAKGIVRSVNSPVLHYNINRLGRAFLPSSPTPEQVNRAGDAMRKAGISAAVINLALRGAREGSEGDTNALESARSAGGRAAALANAYNRATNEETKARILEQIERELQRNPQ